MTSSDLRGSVAIGDWPSLSYKKIHYIKWPKMIILNFVTPTTTREQISPKTCSSLRMNDLEVNKGHFERQSIVAYIIVEYRNSISNDENSILKINDLK